MRTLSPKTLQAIRSYFLWDLKAPSPLLMREWRHVVDEVERALAPRRSLAPARKRKAAKLRSKKSETRDIRAAVVKRAAGVCECGCGVAFTPLDPGELDHFFGRVRYPQCAENTWFLRASCHRMKTRNEPSMGAWLGRFIVHTGAHTLFYQRSLAEALAAKHRARATLRGRA